MSIASKVEVCLFTLLALAMLGCGAVRPKPVVKPIMLRNIVCKKVSESGQVIISDCKCNAPIFAFNAKTSEQEIQCAGETK